MVEQRNYQTIARVAVKLSEKVLEEHEKLLIYYDVHYDVATMRLRME